MNSAGPVEVGVDGEALTMDPPLRFVIRPGALTVRLPRAALSRTPAPPAVHVASAPTLAALWRTALGRPAVRRELTGRRSRRTRRAGRPGSRSASPAGSRRVSPETHPVVGTGRPGCCATLGRHDRAAYTAVARMSTPVLDVPLRRLSRFANYSKPWFLTAAALALFGGPTGRRAAVTGVAAIGAASLVVNQPMKLAGRPAAARPRRPRRPRGPVGADADLDVVPVRPLGIGRRLRRRRRSTSSRPCALPLGAAAGTVAFSRVYTGVHYPGDVLVGAATGALLGRAVTRLAQRRARG